MSIAQQNIGRQVERNLPLVGGGAVGVGAPAILREFADVQNGQPFSLLGEPGSTLFRLTRPSVAWGLGAGAATGLLWMLSAGPDALEDFYMAHTITALPSGALSAALPVEASGNGGGGQQQSGMPRRVRESRATSDGEFEPSGGRSPDTRPAQ